MAGTPTAHIGLALSPPAVHWHGKPVTVALQNIGSVPMAIHAEYRLLHSGCSQYVVQGVSAKPDAFTLQPHQVEHVTVSVPAVHADYGILFVYTPKQSGKVTIRQAVGVQVENGQSVHSCIVHHKPKTAATVHHHADNFPLATVGLVALGFASLLLAVLLVFVLRSAKKTSRPGGFPPAS